MTWNVQKRGLEKKCPVFICVCMCVLKVERKWITCNSIFIIGFRINTESNWIHHFLFRNEYWIQSDSLVILEWILNQVWFFIRFGINTASSWICYSFWNEYWIESDLLFISETNTESSWIHFRKKKNTHLTCIRYYFSIRIPKVFECGHSWSQHHKKSRNERFFDTMLFKLMKKIRKDCCLWIQH